MNYRIIGGIFAPHKIKQIQPKITWTHQIRYTSRHPLSLLRQALALAGVRINTRYFVKNAYLTAREKPVSLILFEDHQPTPLLAGKCLFPDTQYGVGIRVGHQIVGHGYLAAHSNNGYFRFAIHGAARSERSRGYHFTGQGYGKLTLELVAALFKEKKLFPDNLSHLVYPLTTHDFKNQNFTEETDAMAGFLVRYGFKFDPENYGTYGGYVLSVD